MVGNSYQVFGKVSFFQGAPQMTHPEIEPLAEESPSARNFLEPVYSTTEKLKARGLGARQIAKLTQGLFMHLGEKELPENLPDYILQPLNWCPGTGPLAIYISPFYRSLATSHEQAQI
ncbi:hypothetical protein [Paraflavitalea speifideaquila]|uniref:hypothetical protein n=1 Tax=Paraflavitalea speifideaquila TaxID=3076558 RepID=UPI0028E2F565|nr:hypothetical protein [Paraflavitalea speifideiaquila]